MSAPKIIIESCVDSLSSAVKAEQNGATQIELCSRLDLDGLTPDLDLVHSVLAAVSIPVKVMIRPRAGDFNYTASDKAQIRADVDKVIEAGARHFVYGSILNRALDVNDIEQLIEYISAKTLHIHSFTIHKAIDAALDPIKSIEALKRLARKYDKINFYVLSSGKALTAVQGAGLLNEMIDCAASELQIIAAGGITSENFDHLLLLVHAKAYHGRKIVPLND